MSVWDVLLRIGQCHPLLTVATESNKTWKEMNNGGNDASKRRKIGFLERHRPDGQGRFLVDPSQVRELLQYQGEQIINNIKEEEKRASDDAWHETKLSLTSIEVSSTSDALELQGMECIAPSECSSFATRTTTTTSSTRRRNNTDRCGAIRYQQSQINKFQILKEIEYNVEEESRTEYDPAKIDYSYYLAKNGYGDQPQAETPCRSPSRMGINAFTSCLERRPKGAPLKSHSPLYLSMKAQFSNFYYDKYLAAFPRKHDEDCGYYLPVARRANCIPSLANISDLSFSTMGSYESYEIQQHTHFEELQFGMPIACDPIRLVVDDSSFLDLGITGSLGLVDRISPTIPTTPSTNTKKSPEQYKVLLHRRSGVPIAICSLKSPFGPPVVRIYAIKPRIPGQKPAATTASLGLNWCDASYSMYAWAEFTAEGEFPSPVRYSLHMSQGYDGRFESEPSYKASHPMPGIPVVRVVGRTGIEKKLRGAAVISFPNDGMDCFALSIAEGIDPALIICLAAIIDETMEKTMRLKYDVAHQFSIKSKR